MSLDDTNPTQSTPIDNTSGEATINEPSLNSSDATPLENAKIPVSHIVETEEVPKEPMISIEQTNNYTFNNNQNSLIKDEDTIKMLQTLNFWGKFHVILGFISAGMLLLVGFVYIFLIITIPITIIYWIMAGISIWLLTYLYRAFNKINELSMVKTQAEFNTSILQGLDYMKSYYKITGILSIVTMILLILLIFVLIFFAFAFGATPELMDAFNNGKFAP